MESVNLDGSKPIRQLTSLSRKEMKLLAGWALQIVGGTLLDKFMMINQFIYVSVEAIKGYVVVILRPLLLAADMEEEELRLLYHSFADRNYKGLNEHLLTLEDLAERSILLVGATDAGLAATYLALRLIRKNPVVASVGGWYNRLGQIQVITMNSPAPFTPEAIQVYRLPQTNMLDFALEVPSQGFIYAGILQLCKPPIMLPSIPRVNDENRLIAYFQGQALNIFNVDARFNVHFAQPSAKVLAKRLTSQQEKAQEGVVAATADFTPISDIHHQQDLDSCTNALKARLQQALASKMYEGGEFVKKFHLDVNWAISPQVQCHQEHLSILSKRKSGEEIADIRVVCSLAGTNGMSEFASYWLNIDQPSIMHTSKGQFNGEESLHPDEHSDHQLHLDKLQDQVPMPLSPSNQRQPFQSLAHEGSSHLSGGSNRFLDNLNFCLNALFQQQPELRIFSPFHSESSNVLLSFKVWPPAQRTCRARLISSNALARLYDKDRTSFIALMASPAITNPVECQRATLPAAITKEQSGNSSEYWLMFLEYVRNYLHSDIFTVEQLVADYAFEKESDGAAFLKNVFSILHSGLDKDAATSQYDCTKPEVLWHSENFCPKMCRVLVDSNFCKRVYIGESGLKMSLRGESAVHESVDNTKRQWEVLFGIKKRFADRDTIVLKLKSSPSNERHPSKTFYAAIFLEGEQYAEHAKNIFPDSGKSNIK